MRLFADKSVRKNLTLDETVANTLECLSKVSGLSQGEILSIAMRQPSMMNLMAFGVSDIESPIAYIMDQYQARGELCMTQEITEGFVQVLLHSILPRAMVRVYVDKERACGLDAKSINEYIASHMGNQHVDELPGFAECKTMAETGVFLLDQGENYIEASKQHIERYLRTMLAYMDKPAVYANDYLIRNLVVIFRDFCPVLSGFDTPLESRMFQYRACAKVLAMLVPVGLTV